MAGTQHRKMVDIDVSETSGVDHPAHLHEGWIVCKSATSEHVEALFGALNTRKGTDVANDTKTTLESAEKAAGPTVEDLQKQVADLTAKLAKAEAAKPVAKSAETEQEELLKSVPPAVREMLEKSARDTEELRKAAAEDRENLQKERDARLDEAAVTRFEATFKSVALDAKTVAPALRQIEVINPALAKSITEALSAAEGQLSTAGLFKEIGDGSSTAGNGSAYEQIVAKGEEIRKSESGKDLTAEQAFAKALMENPDLYTAYAAEKAGK